MKKSVVLVIALALACVFMVSCGGGKFGMDTPDELDLAADLTFSGDEEVESMQSRVII